MALKAAIYHFTNESKCRPKIYRDQLEALKAYAESVGLDVVDIYCDMSIKMSERTEFDRFLNNSEQYDALVIKNFYHISKNTAKCVSIVKELHDRGLQIHSIENGVFAWTDEPFDEHLRVATYCCQFGETDNLDQIVETQNDILALYSKKKTQWTVVDQYFDTGLIQNNGEKKQLMKLIKNKDKYDLLLVHNLNDLHWRTSNLCKIRDQLQLDIYSLQDGFLHYRKEIDT